MGNHCCCNFSPETKFLRNPLNILNDLTDFIDFAFYVGHRSAGEGSFFVYWTKQALVPWTVACQPQKQTLAFTRGSYGTLLDHSYPLLLFHRLFLKIRSKESRSIEDPSMPEKTRFPRFG